MASTEVQSIAAIPSLLGLLLRPESSNTEASTHPTTVIADPGLRRTVLAARDGDDVLAGAVAPSAVERPGWIGGPSEADDDLRSGGLDVVATAPLRAFVMAALATDAPLGAGRTLLAVTATGREAEDLASELRGLVTPELADQIVDFPSWETLPHERLSPRADTVGRRLAVLRRLAHPDPGSPATGPVRVLICSVRSLLQPMVAGLGELVPVQVAVGDTVEVPDLVQRLVQAAYVRTDLVTKRGEFAVRGGIVDVFPPTEEHPVRVELWGDDVEDIRWFSVADQRSLEPCEHGLLAPPCREMLLTDEVRARARELQKRYPSLIDVLDAIADGRGAEGMESLAPVLVDRMELLVEVMPTGSSVVLCDPERIRGRAHDLVATSEEFLAAAWANATVGNATPLDLGAASYRGLGEVRATAASAGLGWATISPFGTDPDEITVDANPIVPYRGDVERALSDAADLLALGWRVVIMSEGQGPAKRLSERLRDAGVPARLHGRHSGTAGSVGPVAVSADPVPRAPALDPGEVFALGMVHVVHGALAHGFLAPTARVALFTETDLVGSKGATKELRRTPVRRRGQIDPLELRPGDFVVHESHGVARYIEMTSRIVAGATREYLVLEYSGKRGQPPDRLYVPTDQLHLVTRYVGGESPTVNRLGGGDWEKTKSRARKAVRQIAGELIRLYAARQAAHGHAFGPDTPWQAELEDAFPYNETPDQLSTVEEVKADMEKPIPMDRLVCGDVGYGKTEIAVRAVFKAVADGKQAAVLVPTTLLVQQHLTTFTERFAPFPVTVRALSRFSTDSAAKEVLGQIADGSLDVVIGTHRLLGSEVSFKDLGLVVVDEEQRFGVEHKERLKSMRIDVDTLTLSATPIPRTLEMAITGIREMSVITTPPEERHPVLTAVGPYDPAQVTAALRRELLRDGQVFYIHNRVESIERAAARIREMVPEARVVVAHGQMNEHLLEQVVVDFWERKTDILVCTTIVESGLDISNANTLVVERADMLGLSQLHQLRGRVGRGRERAYAYFLFPPDKPLTETAHDRLATIAAHTDLGSGMAVAMKDLEIRGAGNLLGGEQSGHIAEVGFDMYVRMVGEAVSEFRGQQPKQEAEIRVELPVDAHIPAEYVDGERLRLEAYKRIAAASDSAAVQAVREELLDRFGPLPGAVENLLEVAAFRVLCREVGLNEVVVAGPNVRFNPVQLLDSRQVRLARLYPKATWKPATGVLLVPRPVQTDRNGRVLMGAEPVRDRALLAWASQVVTTLLVPDVPKP